MKKYLITSLIATTALITSYATESEETSVTVQSESHPEVANKLGYMRIGIGARDETDLPGPSLGFGKRYESAANAIDVSVSFAFSPYDSKRKGYFYTAPRLMYLRYLMPSSSNSLYTGVGLSYGGIVDRKNQDDERVFHGLMGNASLGIEFNRKSIFRNFLQLDVTQPLVPLYKTKKTPRAAMELSFGVAY